MQQHVREEGVGVRSVLAPALSAIKTVAIQAENTLH